MTQVEAAQQRLCGVPGCELPRETEDCCACHGAPKPRAPGVCVPGQPALPNDGVIDWMAIDTVVRALRAVRLTWVETDIAAAIISNQGAATRAQFAARLGLTLSGRSRRKRIEHIAAALRAEQADGE